MADSIRNVVNSQPVVLDPNFFLPPGVVDARYINDEDTAGLYDNNDPTGTDSDTTEVVDDSTTDTPIVETPNTIQPPANITIVSQTVRAVADGRYVVDVVIDVEDVPGISTYETRLTKT